MGDVVYLSEIREKKNRELRDKKKNGGVDKTKPTGVKNTLKYVYIVDDKDVKPNEPKE